MEEMTLPWVAPLLRRLPPDAKDLPQALLLTGQAGLGKRETALYLARALLCEASRPGFGACGECTSCHLVAARTHPDLELVELGAEEEGNEEGEAAAPAKKPARQIPVDRVRALAEFVSTTAHRGRAKVILIAPAEAMHPSAANAVLKILEEPPGKTHFLLVSHHPDRLLATIRSRCFRLAFAAPPPEVARTWLQTRGVSEPGLALALGSFAPLAATGQDPEGEFWSQRKDLLDVLARPGFSALSAAEKAEAIDGPVLARLLAQWAYDLTLLKSGCPARYHLDFRAGLEKVAKSAPVGALTRWYDMVVQYGRVAQHPLNRRLAMESLLAGYPGLK